MTSFYEDLAEGDRFQFDEYTITAEEIRSFADQFDPQPFHLDPEGAADSVFDGLVASGWHTASISQRLLVENVFSDVEIMAGRGVNDLRWHEPVRPEDTLSGWTEVVAKSPVEHRPDRGNVEFAVTIEDEDDETLLSYTTLAMVRRRP